MTCPRGNEVDRGGCVGTLCSRSRRRRAGGLSIGIRRLVLISQGVEGSGDEPSSRTVRRPMSTNQLSLYIPYSPKAQARYIPESHRTLHFVQQRVKRKGRIDVLFVFSDFDMFNLHSPKSHKAIWPVKSKRMFSGFRSLYNQIRSYNSQ